MTDPSIMYETLDLGQGWRAKVIAGSQATDPDSRTNLPSPSMKEWTQFLGAFLTDATQLPGYALLKYSRAGEVVRTRLHTKGGSLDVVFKQSRLQGWVRGIQGRIRVSREARHFELGAWLHQLGIGTALPLALVERRSPQREAWLVNEYLPNVMDLDQLISTRLPRLDRIAQRKTRNALIDATVELLCRLEGAGYSHRDLKASNILVSGVGKVPGSLRLYLVDMDGLRRSWWCGYRRWQPIIRLAASLRDQRGLTRSDGCRFLRAFLARLGQDVGDWKRHFRTLERNSWRYLQQSKKRKAGKLEAFSGD